MLKDLNVIITRPREQAEKLKEKIISLGGNATVFPTIEIEHIAEAQSEITKLLQNNHFDYIIFNSRNAVTKITSILSTMRSAKIFAVGPATAQVLQQFGLSVQHPHEKFDSEHLLHILKSQKINQKQILILGGEGGRTYLADELAVMGGLVTKFAVYRRMLPEITKTTVQKITNMPKCIIVSTSCENLKNLNSVMQRYEAKAWLLKTVIVVISDRMKKYGLNLGFQESLLQLSKNATDDAILECIIKWYSTGL